jgi:hypothetical protein
MRFRGYVRRFGEVVAEFDNPAMQVITRHSTPIHSPHSASILFRRKRALMLMIDMQIKRGLNYSHLQEVINNWPSDEAGANLASHI